MMNYGQLRKLTVTFVCVYEWRFFVITYLLEDVHTGYKLKYIN